MRESQVRQAGRGQEAAGAEVGRWILGWDWELGTRTKLWRREGGGIAWTGYLGDGFPVPWDRKGTPPHEGRSTGTSPSLLPIPARHPSWTLCSFPSWCQNCSRSGWWERLKLEIGWAQNYEALRTSHWMGSQAPGGLGVGLTKGMIQPHSSLLTPMMLGTGRKSAEASSSWGCLGRKTPSTRPGMILKG